MAYKLRVAYSYNISGFVTKLQKLRLLLFWFYFLFYICCHYVYCEDREIHRNQYRRVLSIQLGHFELFISLCARRVPLFTLSDLLTFVQLPR